MAKMKVHELAKELGVESKELLVVIKNKGIEVKSHMSVLEDGQVEDIKNAMKAPGKSAEAPMASEKKETETTEAKEVKTEKSVETPVKKKKSIIVVSNPNNSKMPGGTQTPKKPAKPVAPKSQPVKAEEKSVEKAVDEPVKVVEPVQEEKSVEEIKVVAPAPKAVEEPVKVEEKPVEKVTEEPIKEAPQVVEKSVEVVKPVEAPKAVATEQPRRNNDGQRSFDGQRRNNDGQRNFDGQRRNNDGQRRPFDQNRNQGARPGQGYQSRGGFDKDKDERNDRGGQRNDGRGGFGQRQGGKPGNKSFMPESPIKDAEKHRDEEKRRISQEKDKKNRKDFMYEDDGDMANIKGKNKAGKFIKPEKKPVEQVEEQIKVITIPETLTIKELADKMKMQPSAIVKKLFLQGQIVTVNQEITYETAENIAIEYDIICEQEVKVDVIEELLKEDEENQDDMISRPPVICVMGHVDHGKTSLLDAIRKTNVTDKEAGGITQHIGAYTVTVNDQKITFLDTPGHEAFTAMRMRGASSTDIAILVVAADDGVMPQTVEAINHAKAAGIEIIVAVNKMDKPGANIERVKQELTEHGLIAEDWGGSTIFVPVSAKNGENIDTLLEMILLTSEVLELKANPNRRARGLVIEAELDKGRGPVATILVQKGTLKVGDFVSAGAASGKVRAMIDDKGRRVKEAGPSTPVEILGLGDVPNAGEIFLAHANDKEAKYYAETFVAQNKEKLLEETKTKMSLDDLFSQIQAGNLKELNLIIKADVQGSVEAVKQSLMKLSNEEVVVKCIHGGVGAINESDVILASASKAIIIGFNVRPDAQAKTTAEREGVDVRLYRVIYQAIEDIEAAMKGMLDPVFEEKVIGHAEVRQIFKASAVGNIAGSYVLDGVFQRGCKIRITREGEQIYEGELASLKRFKDDVKEVKTGFECGLVFDGFDGMQEFDIVEAYIMVEVPR